MAETLQIEQVPPSEKLGGRAVTVTSLKKKKTVGRYVEGAFSPQGETCIYNTRQLDEVNDSVEAVGRTSTPTICTADTQVSASACVITGVTLSASAAVTAGVWTLYDNTAESGTQVLTGEVQGDIDFIHIDLGDAPIEMSTGAYLGFDGSLANVNVIVHVRND